ncbi:MAG: secretin N-terminal domain-containing protein, partial [Planctomycetaceae bacterium]
MKSSLNRSAFALAMIASLLSSPFAMAQRPGGGNRGGGGPGGGFGFGGGGGGGSTLGLLLRESNAEELKLTDEQKTKIREISDKHREDTRIRDLGGKMRDASEEERTALLADIAKIVEEQRNKADVELKQVLSAEQFTRYRQLAVQSRGISSLADSDIADELKLTEEQLEKLKVVSEELAKRRTEMMEKLREAGGRSGFEEMRTKGEELRKEFEEKRLAILTDAQRVQWTAMKGPEPVAAAETSRPASGSTESTSRPTRSTAPAQNPEAAVSQAIGDDKPRKPVVSFGKSADEYASAKSAALTATLKAEKPAEGESNKAEPPKPEKISFNFRHAPWADVLKTFAELAGLTLDLNVVPPGTFNYFDDKEYTATEALDVINGYLLQKGYVLVRRDQFLVVVNIDDKIPPNLVPKVKVGDLAKRGHNELMTIVIRVENITAEEAAEEAKELIGPQGSVVALKRSSAISVTDIGSNLQNIYDLLVGLGAAPSDISFKSYDVKHIDALEAEDKVRAIFGLPRGVESVAEGTRSRYSSSSDGRGGELRDKDGRPIAPIPTTTKPKVQISSDERTNRLLITANPGEHKIIDELLKTIDVEELPGSTRRPRSREPFLHVYSVKTADAQEVAKTLNVLFPGCVVNEDGRARRIHVYATPTQHEQIERMVKQLDGEGVGGISVAVVSTGRIDSLTAVATLQALFAAEKDAAPSLTPLPTGYGLIVRGTNDQVNQIKLLLTQMDPNALKGEPQKGTLRTIPLGGRDPEEFSLMLKQFWGAKNSNPIIIVPSNSQPVRDQRVPSATPSTSEPASSRETIRPPRTANPPTADRPLEKPTSSKRKAPKPDSTPISPPRAQTTQAAVFTVSTDRGQALRNSELAERPI